MRKYFSLRLAPRNTNTKTQNHIHAKAERFSPKNWVYINDIHLNTCLDLLIPVANDKICCLFNFVIKLRTEKKKNDFFFRSFCWVMVLAYEFWHIHYHYPLEFQNPTVDMYPEKSSWTIFSPCQNLLTGFSLNVFGKITISAYKLSNYTKTCKNTSTCDLPGGGLG